MEDQTIMAEKETRAEPDFGDGPDPRIDTARTNLRIACAMRGINFSEAARRAGMSRNGVSQFVAGRTSISYANMLAVCDVVGVPIGLLHRPDHMSEARIRLHRMIDRLPVDAALEALAPLDPDGT